MEPEQVIELIKSLDNVSRKNKVVDKVVRRLQNGKYNLHNSNIVCNNQIICSYEEFNSMIVESEVKNLVIVYAKDYSIKIHEMVNFEQIENALVYDISGILDQKIFDRIDKPVTFSNLIIMDRTYYNLIMFVSSLINN